MKKLLVLALCLSIFSAFGEQEGGRFEERKSKMLSHLDARISHLHEAKTCVYSAKDKDALKACHQKMKENRKEIKDKWKEKREERREKQKNK